MKGKLVVIAGPTAVGKTAVAIKLAKELKTEIISADSRQFFRELNIGTAKPDDHELQLVRHHFVNSHSITENYDAAQFGRDALKIIEDLLAVHDYAILCGGSGLYIKAVTEGFDDIPEVPDDVRDDLITQFNRHGITWLQQKMMEADPVHFATIDQQNPHRLIRALEVKLATGISIADFRSKTKTTRSFGIVKIGLDLPRAELYQRIDDRMDSMIKQGLFAEAERLRPFRNHNALQTVGYQEIFGHMDGLYDRDECIRLLKRNSRRYAKRQLTWFRRDAALTWFHPADIAGIVKHVQHQS